MGGTDPAGGSTTRDSAAGKGIAPGGDLAAGGVTAAVGGASVDYREKSSAMPPGSEHTGVCGTSFYISPEISNGWASYDAKV